MSGFFSLGGSKDQDHHHQTDSNNSLFLFKNEEIYNKGFELWQQYYQLHHQKTQTHHHNIQDVDFSVGPSNRRSIGGGGGGDDSGYSYRSAGIRVTRQGRSGAEGSINCQDCGNQSKKDCAHMRCRTCCKSRGFPCPTHVKSTWVPAAKRRERQQQLAALQQENTKRPREIPAAQGSATSGFELSNFPAEVNSTAVFRCVRVSAMDDAEEHLGYQTAVNIGGHVFRGILYDQGPDNRYSSGGAEGSSAGGSQNQPLDLIASSGGSAVAATAYNQNMAMIDIPSSSSIYPPQLNAFMAGTQFFPPPRG